MQDAQRYVETKAPGLQRLGIRGSSDGWASPFEPWQVLLPNARKELDAMKSKRRS